MSPSAAPETLRRWRLVLGGDDADGINVSLTGADLAMDNALQALYEPDNNKSGKRSGRQGGLGSSAPNVARWLGDIRTYFPSSVVRVMQQDAMERLNLRQMLLEPEMLQAVEPDVHLVANLIALSRVMPEQAPRRPPAWSYAKSCDESKRKLAKPAAPGRASAASTAPRATAARATTRSTGTARSAPTSATISRTYKTIIPETRIGYGRKRMRAARHHPLRRSERLDGDQRRLLPRSSAPCSPRCRPSRRRWSYSTPPSSISPMNSQDPVDLLFGTQLGGGTDINRALSYCQCLIRQPHETILVLISDLYEGGNREEMLKRAARPRRLRHPDRSALLALSDDGAPGYDHTNAAAFAALGAPAFACTPDLFPDLMAAAIARQDLNQWAAARGIVAATSGDA